jgi:hypothetical protein
VGGSRYSWKAAGRQQELVEGSRNPWKAAGTRGRQQELVGGSRYPWEMPSGEDSAVLISVGALKLGT